MTASILSPRSSAFTLVEVLVAFAIGSVIFGITGMMYVQGNRAFTSTTEHASFREEALVCLETIGRDLEQIVVSTQNNPSTGKYYLVEPFELLHTYALRELDPATGKALSEVPGATGLRFYRYHHTETVPDSDVPAGLPKLIGTKVEYETRPIDSGKPELGVDLLRNGKRVNRQPLSEVVFQQEQPAIAVGQMKGSPHAVLTVSVIPRGGVWGKMSVNTIRKLKETGTVATRTFHLVGYESMYTAYLFVALQKASRGDHPDPLEAAIIDDARTTAQPLYAQIAGGLSGSAPLAYSQPSGLVEIEHDTAFDDATAARDDAFASAAASQPVTPGTLGPGRSHEGLRESFAGMWEAPSEGH